MRQNGPKGGQQAMKMCFGTVLDHFGSILDPPNGLGSPKSEVGTGQNGPKGRQQAHKMCFETVLDHLDTILVHFQPKLKIEKKNRDFDHFGPF